MKEAKPIVAVIGGGAAGFFAAISCKEHHPDAEVIILEKTNKLLSKVKVSGGGRCNVCNAEREPKALAAHYPRGEKQLRKLFGTFATNETMEWFAKRGVELKAEADGRVFPRTDSSQTIIDCFLREAERLEVRVLKKMRITEVVPLDQGFRIGIEGREDLHCDKVIVATGGHPQMKSYEWLEELGHRIEPPVPSLFTFNMPKDPITEFMGISVEKATLRIQGTKLKASGPLLITHWGMSGPAVLRLSAWGARILNEMDYRFRVQVAWANELNEEIVRETLEKFAAKAAARMLKNANPFGIPARLWLFLVQKAELKAEAQWDQLGGKNRNRLINLLINDSYQVSGKTTFKEEFVTCGGVSLKSINMATMESRACPGIFFAGELIDVDGITGGFNFQAAWTTGFFAGKFALSQGQ